MSVQANWPQALSLPAAREHRRPILRFGQRIADEAFEQPELSSKGVKAAAQPSQAARQRIEELEDQLKQALTDREEADEAFLAKAQLVVNGVLADPTEGADSALYEAMGYTRKSERRSGLTRKRNPPPKP